MKQLQFRLQMPLGAAEHRKAVWRELDECLSGASFLVEPKLIAKHRKPVGQAWAALLFGSFILGTQNK